MLIGTRARPAERDGIELIVPNPSGGRGVYLFDWAQLEQVCQPSLHDLALTERVTRLRLITPATIRRAASEVAAAGLAGREVAAAAAKALRLETQAGLLTNFTFLVTLMRQIEAPVAGQPPPEREDPTRLQQRAKKAIAEFAPQLKLNATEIANMLEELAEIFVRVGLAGTSAQAFLPRLVRILRHFKRDLAAWAAVTDGPTAELGRQIASQAGTTLLFAEPLIAACHSRAQNVVQLLRDNISGPAKLASEIARPDWLLDGWELVCLRWRASAQEERPQVIEELATMLPAIPDEVEDWGYNGDGGFDRSWLRKVRSGHDWRSGLAAFHAIERGEETLRLAYDGDEG